MTPERWEAIQPLLHEALALEPEERVPFLARIGAEDPELCADVESFMRAYDARPGFLETPYLGDAGNFDHRTAWTGRVLGAYALMEKVGAGGMGEVFRAARADGLYERQVAVKLIRDGLGKESFLQRFANERQILARLDHPNIARLLDGGASEEGIPYVVMEFIDGAPIDEFCSREQLSIRERMKLFRAVCSAVQYAHQNLVVHRDLKPGNILVTQDGVPKLLDFGIAKILDPRREADVPQSATVLPIMTPAFASPEQVRGGVITTASDVYSLGVILYVLLTGQQPYGLANRSAHELMKAICDTEPLRPSTAVTRCGQVPRLAEGPASPTATADEPPRRARVRLGHALRGDVDSIVLKALRKDPAGRYATVEQFSEDIRRHLDGLPVQARRGTAAYRLQEVCRSARGGRRRCRRGHGTAARVGRRVGARSAARAG